MTCPRRCVLCGQPIDPDRAELLRNMSMPACCLVHEWEVIRESIFGGPSWPEGWFGHAWKSSGDWEWTYTDQPTDQKIR